jgi:hypothetical protein
MSDEQFQQIVELIAATRVEFRQALSDLQFDIRTGFAGVRRNQIVAEELLAAIEGDVGRIQLKLRDHEQCLDGLVQLGKTNFEMNESVLKAIHGESGSSTMHHGETEESRGTGPQ